MKTGEQIVMNKIKSNCFYFSLLLLLLFMLFVVCGVYANETGRVYPISFAELKSLLKIKVPPEHSKLMAEVLNAKKQNKTSGEIGKMLLLQFNIKKSDLLPLLKQMNVPDKMEEFCTDMVLNKKPVLELVIKGAITAPKYSPQYNMAKNFIKDIKKTLSIMGSNFNIRVVLYPGGVMGDEPDFIRKVKLGQLQFASGTLAMGEMVCPALSVFDLPFLFDYEPKLYYDELKYCEIDWVFGKAAPTINRLLEEKGFILGGIVDAGGYINIASLKVPIRTAEDLKKITFYALPYSRIAGDVNRVCGFNKTIVCKIFDMPTMVATGMLNSGPCAWYTQILMQALSSNFKYVTSFPIRGYMAGISLQSKEMYEDLLKIAEISEVFTGITKEAALNSARSILLLQYKTIKETVRYKIRSLEAKSRKVIIEKKIYEVIELKNEEIEKIKSRVLPLYYELADKKGKYPKWFLDEILGYREEYRKLKKEGMLTEMWYKKGIFPDGYDEYAWIKTWGSKQK